MSDDDNNDDNGRHKETFNFIIDDESLGASNLRDHLKKLEEQKVLFEKLSNSKLVCWNSHFDRTSHSCHSRQILRSQLISVLYRSQVNRFREQ